MFLFQKCAGTSLLETWISANVLLSIGNCLRLFPRGAYTLTERGWRFHSCDWDLSAYYPTQLGKPPPRFLGIWSRIPQLPQRHFEWMLKFYFGGRGCPYYTDTFSCFFWRPAKLSLPWFNITCFLELCLAHGRHSNVAKDESKFLKVAEVFNLQNQMPMCTYIFCNIWMCKLI